MCWYCGAPVTEAEPIGRSLRCSCGKDLRSCRNCRFFRPGARGDCAESAASCEAAVTDKERGNFCDWFSLNPAFRSQTSGEQKARSKEADAKAAFDNLFK
jgi:hypothetical protein